MNFRLLTKEETVTVPGMISPVPDSLFAVGAVDEHGVAACIGCFAVLHADPVWIRPDLRANGKTLLRLWEATRAELLARGLGGVEVIMTENVPGEPTESLVARACEKAGGYEVKARTFIVPVR